MASWRLALVSLVVLLGTGCTTRSDPTPAPAPLRLDASVAQYRFDEGTRNLKAGVTNNSDRGIRVSQATIVWAALAFPVVHLPEDVILPGQTAAFSITYGAPRCAATAAATKPVLVTVIDGRSRELPLRVEDPGLLRRLHAKACAQQRLARVATVTLRLARRTEQVDGEEYLPGDIVLRHRPGATGRVRLVDLGGSVLIDLVPRGGRRALPAELAPNRSTEVFPVLFGSAHRCDDHGLGQSSQTFLVSAYVRLEDRPPLRVILPLSPPVRDLLMSVVLRDCGRVGQ